jgi:hypothetical protein
VRKLAAGKTYSFALFARGALGVTAAGDDVTAKTNRLLSVATMSLPEGTAGMSYLAAVSASGGVGRYSWTATGLPAGLSMAADGTISGFPSATGTSSITVHVTDSAKATAVAALALAVPSALPSPCVAQSCSVVKPDGATLQVPAADIVSVTRGTGGTVSSAVLTGISVASGDIVVLGAGSQLATGLVALAGALTSNADGTTTVALTPGTVGDADASGTVQALGATTEVTRKAAGRQTAAEGASLDCDHGVTSSLEGLGVTDQFTPTLTAIWKHPWVKAGGFYPGPGGLDTFFASLDGSVKVNMGVTVSGSATCTLTLPGVTVPAPAGDLGEVDLGVDPSLTFTVNGKIDVRATATLRCGSYYEWTRTGGSSGGRYCIPSYTAPKLSTPGGVSASLTGALDVSLTLDDTTGIQGDIDSTLHLGYNPGQHPDAELDASSDWDIQGVLAKWWKDGPSVTIASGTVLPHKVLWSSNLAPPLTPPVITTTRLPAATAGQAYTTQLTTADHRVGSWAITSGSLPAGLTLTGHTISGTPTTVGTSSFTLKFTDTHGQTATAKATFPVNRAGTTTGWNPAIEVPGSAILNTGNYAQADSVACTSAGNCTTAGSYTDSSDNTQVFVAGEVNGTWQNALEVPGTATLNTGGEAAVNSVSCASAGNCTVGGYYYDSSDDGQAFVADEVNGTWQDALEVPGTATLNTGGGAGVGSVSCASAGNCTAGGSYASGGNEAFVAGEVNGTWQDAIEVPGTAALNTGGDAGVGSVSCASAGNCTAAGGYTASSLQQVFVADEVNGTWQKAIEVPGTATLNTGSDELGSVSCGSAGNCTVGGSYQDPQNDGQAFVADEVNGTWQDAIEVPGTATLNTGGNTLLDSVSCASAGNCAAGGFYLAPNEEQAFVADEVNGTWQNAIEVPGTATLNTRGQANVTSVSCTSAGTCAAGGYYAGPDGLQAFVSDKTSGT